MCCVGMCIVKVTQHGQPCPSVSRLSNDVLYFIITRESTLKFASNCFLGCQNLAA